MSDQFSGRPRPLIQIMRDAEDPRGGATLAELSQFVQDAERAGIDPRTTVLVRVGFSGQIKKVQTGGRSR